MADMKKQGKRKRKWIPKPADLSSVARELLNLEFAVKQYRLTYFCLKCQKTYNAREYSDHRYKCCPWCGEPIKNLIIKQRWQPCSIAFLPYPQTKPPSTLEQFRREKALLKRFKLLFPDTYGSRGKFQNKVENREEEET